MHYISSNSNQKKSNGNINNKSKTSEDNMVTKIRKTIIVATKTTATVMAATQPLT